MTNCMSDILSWIIIIGSLAVPVIVIRLQKTKGDGRRRHRLIRGLCIALGVGVFMIAVLKWRLGICIACGMILRLKLLFFGEQSSTLKEDYVQLYLDDIRKKMQGVYLCYFNDKHYHFPASQLTSTP